MSGSLLSFMRSYNNGLWVAVCLLLLVPSFLINNGASHDWGGDFALYIRQAINMVVGIPQTDNGYIYNAECPGLGPKTYPVGFPMFLAPVCAAFGNDMAAFIDLMAIFGIAFGLVVFLFFRRSTGAAGAILFAVGISYHPAILEFKREVMSDIPFAILALLTVILIDRKRWWLAVPVLTLASVTRTIGATLFIALALLTFWNWAKSERTAKGFLTTNRHLPVLIIGFVGHLLLNHVIFITDAETGYRSIFGRYPILDVIQGNVEFYSEFLRSFLFNEQGNTIVGVVGLTLMLVLSTIGWLRRSNQQLGLAEIWLPIYIIVLLIYPYRGAGLRFMLPLLPLLFYYAAHSFYDMQIRWRVPAMLLSLSPFLFNMNSTIQFTRSEKENVFGPQSYFSQEMFDFVDSETPVDAPFLFVKPRVLSLYTNRECMSNERHQQVESIKDQVDSVGIQYLLHAKNIWNPGLVSLVESYPRSVRKVFENPEFVLYRYVRED